MNNPLLYAGLACLIAAVIGGGLKLFGIEIPVLQSLKRQVLLGALGIALILFSYSVRPTNEPTVQSSQPEPSSKTPADSAQHPKVKRPTR